MRAIERVNTRNSGFTCEHAHHARHRCAHNADHFATSSPFSVFFTEVVCDLSATPLQTTAAPLPSGGELRHARVRHAGDTPPEGFAWRKTPTATSVERAAGAEGQAGAPVGGGSPATAHTEGATAKQISPNKNHAAPLRYKTLPAHPLAPHVRYKTLPAHPFPPHVRYKTLPARASRPHFR